MSKHVTTVFETAADAVQAADRLVDAGFDRDRISLLMSDETRGRHFAVRESTRAVEGTAAGAAAGGAFGAVAAAMVAAGTIVAPPLGLFAAGPLVAAITGLGAGATVGGVLGAAYGATLPDHEVSLVSDQVAGGGVLLGVETADQDDARARDILMEAGAAHVRVY